MRAVLVFLLFWGYALGARYYYVCQVKGMCAETPAEEGRLRTLGLREGDRFILEGYEQFYFDTISVFPRLSANNRVFLDSVAAYLQRNPEKSLEITGLYRPSEQGLTRGFFENLGVARAAEIRQELVKRGVAENRISLDYVRSPGEVLREPVALEVYSGAGDFERSAFSFENMTFSQANFAFDSDEFRPGDAFVQWADSLKTYLELHPKKEMVIVGHTDDVDTENYNFDLGMRRAKSARQYLRDLGVTVGVEVESEGETKPVASNKTEEGRSKNRRVNFVIIDK